MRKATIFSVTVALLAWAGYAQAAPVCAAAYSASVSSAACELGSTNNDSLAQVNIDAMFGFSDWLFDAKDDDLDGVNAGPNSLSLTLIGDVLSGTWSIASNAFSIYSDIMLVFKDGNGSPNTYVGYLLNSTSGGYTTPFTNPANGNPKDISHVSIYVRGNGTTIVSEPAMLGLLSLGLLSLVIARRRMR